MKTMGDFFNKYGNRRILLNDEENIVLHIEHPNGWAHAPSGAIGSIYVSANGSTDKITWVFEDTPILESVLRHFPELEACNE